MIRRPGNANTGRARLRMGGTRRPWSGRAQCVDAEKTRDRAQIEDDRSDVPESSTGKGCTGGIPDNPGAPPRLETGDRIGAVAFGGAGVIQADASVPGRGRISSVSCLPSLRYCTPRGRLRSVGRLPGVRPAIARTP